MSDRTGRIVAITGGAGGIGEAAATKLAAEGWRVVVLDRNMDGARRVADLCGGTAREIDLADRDSIEAAASFVEREIGPCYGLVTVGALLEDPHRPEDVAPDALREILTVNVDGTFLTATAFGRAMLERKAGSIVTLGSIVGLNSTPLFAYGTSKAAVINLSRSLAVAWGRAGIRVNTICPGPTLTSALLASYARGDRDPAARIRQTALGRIVEPSEVADGICFLLSDRASAITGTELTVDCGITAAQMWNLYNGVPEARA
ncbi:SDR family oxidoreductase [Aquibium carbonis]|uniref:SDR family oxidoreductase n=1 Tax=Aquibium carbonis TaxID=2495581 RepID=A0A429YUM5_9HYPH|nr:SDR family oxidoreductase [Aquibium carbonis]RST85034.1 SDR family oxidoreductase [Aquibium carbonis]